MRTTSTFEFGTPDGVGEGEEEEEGEGDGEVIGAPLGVLLGEADADGV